jgi:hypothetical protein
MRNAMPLLQRLFDLFRATNTQFALVVLEYALFTMARCFATSHTHLKTYTNSRPLTEADQPYVPGILPRQAPVKPAPVVS